ncbi:derepression protein [Yersinia enterocolitica]
MANRKQRRALVQRRHLQTEISRKLNRAHTLAALMPPYLLRQPTGTVPLWLPSILDYLADDLRDIAQEARELGLLPDTPQN